jgi:hypothetical protein
VKIVWFLWLPLCNISSIFIILNSTIFEQASLLSSHDFFDQVNFGLMNFMVSYEERKSVENFFGFFKVLRCHTRVNLRKSVNARVSPRLSNFKATDWISFVKNRYLNPTENWFWWFSAQISRLIHNRLRIEFKSSQKMFLNCRPAHFVNEDI